MKRLVLVSLFCSLSCKSVHDRSLSKAEVTPSGGTSAKAASEIATAGPGQDESFLAKAKERFSAKDFASSSTYLQYFSFYQPGNPQGIIDLCELAGNDAEAKTSGLIDVCFQVAFVSGIALGNSARSALDDAHRAVLDKMVSIKSGEAAKALAKGGNATGFERSAQLGVALYLAPKALWDTDGSFGDFIKEELQKSLKSAPGSMDAFMHSASLHYGAQAAFLASPGTSSKDWMRDVFEGAWLIDANLDEPLRQGLKAGRSEAKELGLDTESNRFMSEVLIPQQSGLWEGGETLDSLLSRLVDPGSVTRSLSQWASLAARAKTNGVTKNILILSSHPALRGPFGPSTISRPLWADKKEALLNFDLISRATAADLDRVGELLRNYSASLRSGLIPGVCPEDGRSRCSPIEYAQVPLQAWLYDNLPRNERKAARQCDQLTGDFSTKDATFNLVLASNLVSNCKHIYMLNTMVDGSWIGGLIDEFRQKRDFSRVAKLGNQLVASQEYKDFKLFDADHGSLVPLDIPRSQKADTYNIAARYLCLRYLEDHGKESGHWHDADFLVESEGMNRTIDSLYYWTRLTAAMANPDDKNKANISNNTVTKRWDQGFRLKNYCVGSLDDYAIPKEIVAKVSLLLSEYENNQY